MKKVHLISLGCDKNLVDSEKMLGLLYSAGYVFSEIPEGSDAVVINTCSFINDASEESVSAILHAADLKKEGKIGRLIITGCLAERYRSDIRKEIPEVDAVLGTNSWQEICNVLDELDREEDRKPEVFVPCTGCPSGARGISRVLTTGGHYAYLKISEGCSKHCTYCIIPSLRGTSRSFPMEELVSEAEKLAADGVKELILVAQETTVYGVDLYGRKALPELLGKLEEIPGIAWIRIMYAYPEEITDELTEKIQNSSKILHYIDMPIQHASDHVLQRMGRRTTRAEITERIRRMRKDIPDLVIRTTMISGFPGETAENHRELLEFIREIGFDRLGCFAYSAEDGTPAAGFPDQISEEIKSARREEVMLTQQECAFARAEQQCGRELRVMIEGRLTDTDEEGNVYVARTYMDAPDVDGCVYINTGEREFMTGDMPMIRVTGAFEYDLTGELI